MTAILHAAGAALAIAGALLAAASGVGVLAVRDAYQRLHFVSVAGTVASFLLAGGVALAAGDASAALKALLVFVALAASNGVLTHATARAAFVRAHGHWPPRPDEVRATGGGEGGG